MNRRLCALLLGPLLALAGCTQGRHQDGSGDVDNVRSSATSATRSPGSPAASAVPSATAPSAAVDLLHRTASVVVTSSHADGISTGAYLVDQLPETSWQPNPPDHTPWIEVDLPAPASIERIEITPVQASRGSLEPLLKAARILVPGAGARWLPHPARRSISDRGELVLEPDTPAKLSRLRLSLAGAPRGLRFAELRAIGAIGHGELLASAIPETHVQGNARLDYSGDLFATWVLGAPYATENALCDAFIRLLAIDPESNPQPPGELCRVLPEIAVTGSAPPELRGVQRYFLTIPDQVSPTETTALVVRAERGLYPANVALTDTRNDGMCPGGPEGDMKVSNFRFEHGALLIDRTRYFAPGTLQQETPQAPPAAAASVLRCRFAGRLSCREFITHFGPPTAVLDENGLPSHVKLPTTWDWSRTVEITRRGSVRLTPCRTPDRKDQTGSIVPCATPGAEVL